MYTLKEQQEIEELEQAERELEQQKEAIRAKIRAAKAKEKKALAKIKVVAFDRAVTLGIAPYLAALKKSDVDILAQFKSEIFKAFHTKAESILSKHRVEQVVEVEPSSDSEDSDNATIVDSPL